MRKNKNRPYLIAKARISFKRTNRRKKKRKLKKRGWHRHCLNILKKQREKSPNNNKPKKGKKPPLSFNSQFLLNVSHVFSTHDKIIKNGLLKIPYCFSLIDNFEESMTFLRSLLLTLYKTNQKNICLDYKNCTRIDVDASICMDIILGDYISYLNSCRKVNYKKGIPNSILPINFSNQNVSKVLFSIGAYKNIKGFNIKYDDIEALPVLINVKDTPTTWAKNELHSTQIVEYIKRCLARMNRSLNTEAETRFYKVIGEIMSNADEHSTMPNRFAIGFFQETHHDEDHYGIFNFTIFNLGATIYETFSKDCENRKVIAEMKALSEEYTQKKWFKKAEFEEETLWTLYALQEGVTSTNEKRGNGSIQYIENFFNLKGDTDQDNTSKLVLLSGNARIVFDGTYKIVERKRDGLKKPYKMITFNNEGQITAKPDKNYVTFAPQFFPGTLISARILIKLDNTNKQ